MKKHRLIAFSLLVLSATSLTACDYLLDMLSVTDDSNETSDSESTSSEEAKTITLNETSLKLKKGDTKALVPTVLPMSDNQFDFTWSSSNDAVCSIDDLGVVTALTAGNSTITCALENDSSVFATCDIEVMKIEATSLKFSSKSLSIHQDESKQLEWTLTPADADVTLVFSVNPSTFLSVSSTGVITGKKPGKSVVTIRTSDGSLKDTCQVTTTKKAVTGIEVDKTSVTIDVGESEQVTAHVLPSDAGDLEFSWSSLDGTIAKVDNTGLITGLKNGTTKCIVTSHEGEFKKEVSVTVNKVNLKGISFEEDSYSLEIGKRLTINPIYNPSNATNKNVTWTSTNTSVATVNNGVVLAVAKGSTTIKATSEEGNYVASCNVSVIEPILPKTELLYDISDVNKNSMYSDDVCPSVGSPKLLVVPVWFEDSSNYITDLSKKDTIKEDIELAYFGTEQETGSFSVKSFYKKESAGNLTLTGEVTDWYCVDHSSSYYDSSNKVVELVNEVVADYKTKKSTQMKDFDTDMNGYLDGVMLIYAAPDYSVCRDSNDNLWAYCFWTQNDDAQNVNNPGANVFFWASYDFMYGDSSVSPYYNGDTSHCTIDSHTFTHEMGHVLGLNDYYDYSDQYRPAAGFSMQDYNVGGHDPYSIMAYGWADPYVPTQSCTIEISPFQESGDLIVLSPEFHRSPFDEYIILELYTPTGCNEFDSKYQYNSRYPLGPSNAGIRIWHVDARLFSYLNYYYDDPALTYNPNDGYVTQAFSNTYYDANEPNGHLSIYGQYEEETKYYWFNELQLIRNSLTATYKPTDFFSNSSMFYTGDTFSMSAFAKQFYYSGKLNSQLDLGFSVTFTSVTSTKAVIDIKKL